MDGGLSRLERLPRGLLGQPVMVGQAQSGRGFMERSFSSDARS